MRDVAARLVLVAALAAAFVATVPGPAAACSCGMGDPAQMLALADAAFIGALVGSPVEIGDFDGDWPFEVERWVKGGSDPTIDVRSPLDGAACGFEITRGARIGVLLYEHEGRLTGGLCSTLDADVLQAAATPLGPVDGEGPIALLVGGTIGPYRLVALDAQGRDLARAEGTEPVYQLSVCPGARHVAELVSNATLAVRDLTTFEVLWQRPLPGPDHWYSTIECRDEDGSEVVALGSDLGGLGLEGLAVSATRDGDRVLAEGPWHEGRLAGSSAVVITGPGRLGVDRVDLATGAATTLFTLGVDEGFGDIGNLVVSPDGRRAAFRAATYHEDAGTSTLHVVDLATGELASHPGGGVALWLDDDTLLDDTGSQLKVLYSLDGAGIAQAGTRQWDFEPRAASGSTVYGTQRHGGVIKAAERDGGTVSTLRVLPSIAVHALVAPAGAPFPQPVATPEPEPPAATTTPTTTSSTTAPAASSTPTAPPVAAPGSQGGGAAPFIALAALGGVVALGGLVWLWRRRSTKG